MSESISTQIKIEPNITIDTHTMTVAQAGKDVGLTRRQFDILVFLSEAEGRPVPAAELAEKVFPNPVFKNTVEVYINMIRHKLGREVIINRHGFGYLVKSRA